MLTLNLFSFFLKLIHEDPLLCLLVASLGACLFLNRFDVECPLKFHLLHLTSPKQIDPSLSTYQATSSLQQILTHCLSLFKPSILPSSSYPLSTWANTEEKQHSPL